MRELRGLVRDGDDRKRISELITELIMGWQPYYRPWLEIRFGAEIAEEADARVREKLVRLLLRKQDFDQPWGIVVWKNATQYAAGDELRDRKKRREVEVSVDDPPATAADPSSEAEFEKVEGPESDVARLHRALDCLPPNHREVVEILFFTDLDHAGAARRLGIKAGTLSVRKLRALEQLRDKWDDV